MKKRTRDRNDRIWFFGFSLWKRRFIPPFFPDYPREALRFVSTGLGKRDSLDLALQKGLKAGDRLCIWGRKEYPSLERWARENDVPLYRAEDGFIRSVGLGSDLTRPYSLVFDSRGIYFDPTVESDLEKMLNHDDCKPSLLERSRRLQKYLLEKKLSKYNASLEKKIVLPPHSHGKRVLLVPGQVEDDASILYGADGMKNLELLQAVRKTSPDAWILYKPHPDVTAGNRKGTISPEEMKKYCDQVIDDVSLDSVLSVADEVHTMTSLVGFEALIRGKKVTTYGMPFYAGWGLTEDQRQCRRRARLRSLDELVAMTLIRYPRYVSPQDGRLCEVEELLSEMEKQKKRYNHHRFYRWRINLRNGFSRKIQWMGRKWKGE